MSLLEITGLSKSFGGVQAVQELEYTVESGKIHSIIGPNGAGKTTLFNMVTGIFKPSSGEVHFNGQDVTGLPVHELAALGISRSFQNLQVFFNMTVLENVMVGRHLHCRREFLQSLLHTPAITRSDEGARHRAAELLEWVGLKAYVGDHADSLPYGALKRMEIARALACEPKLLLLDEPAAGLNNKETQEINELIQQISERGITVVLVEHDMRLVMGVSDHILVMDHGKKLAEGTAAEVRENPDVVAAYLGRGD
ncbi:MAG: ABC transporter ATP-binding protein [Arenicellales bacterium]|nr:ABC transporter ATP-binding protein [Arenicellales bacterium]